MHQSACCAQKLPNAVQCIFSSCLSFLLFYTKFGNRSHSIVVIKLQQQYSDRSNYNVLKIPACHLLHPANRHSHMIGINVTQKHIQIKLTVKHDKQKVGSFAKKCPINHKAVFYAKKTNTCENISRQ